MRNFFCCVQQNLLPNQFRDHEARWLVRDLVFWKIRRPRRERRYDLLQKNFQPVSLSSRNRNDLAKNMQFRLLLNDWKQSALLSEQINLIKEKKDWRLRLFNQTEQ